MPSPPVSSRAGCRFGASPFSTWPPGPRPGSCSTRPQPWRPRAGASPSAPTAPTRTATSSARSRASQRSASAGRHVHRAQLFGVGCRSARGHRVGHPRHGHGDGQGEGARRRDGHRRAPAQPALGPDPNRPEGDLLRCRGRRQRQRRHRPDGLRGVRHQSRRTVLRQRVHGAPARHALGAGDTGHSRGHGHRRGARRARSQGRRGRPGSRRDRRHPGEPEDRPGRRGSGDHLHRDGGRRERHSGRRPDGPDDLRHAARWVLRGALVCRHDPRSAYRHRHVQRRPGHCRCQTVRCHRLPLGAPHSTARGGRADSQRRGLARRHGRAGLVSRVDP